MHKIQTMACPMCDEQPTVELTDEEYEALKSGTLIQKAMPTRSADFREKFLSGYCGKCWDIVFPPEEE